MNLGDQMSKQALILHLQSALMQTENKEFEEAIKKALEALNIGE
jgi:hypothetical protein